jgi:hypothetical protein
MKTSEILRYVKEFVDRGLCRNYWGWLHGMFGAVAGAFCMSYTQIDPVRTLLYVLSLAVLWEIGEAVVSGPDGIYKTYKTFKDFVYDSIGDIALAVFFCFAVIYKELFKL